MPQNMILYLCRHGETEKNYDKRFGSGTDVLNKNSDLNHIGEFQSMTMGDYFRRSDIKIDIACTSSTIRGLKTVELITQFTEDPSVLIHCDDRLYNLSVDKDRVRLTTEFLELISKLREKYSGKTILMVTHNHIIDIIYNLYVNPSHRETGGGKIKVENCSLSKMLFDDAGQVSVEFWDMKVKPMYELRD